MKRTIYFFASAIITLSIFIACSKDQKVVKQLDGKWKVTSETVDGVSTPASSFANEEYSFTACKVKKGDCDGTWTDGKFTLPFKYSISGKGEKINITYNILGSNETDYGTILEHSDKKFVYSTDDNKNKTTVTTLEKK